jgi:hypothetical protein
LGRCAHGFEGLSRYAPPQPQFLEWGGNG